MGIIPLIYAQYNSPNPFFTLVYFCKIRVYVNQWSAMSCRWLLVMACVGRCFACSASAYLVRFLRINLARRIAIGIIIMWMILPIYTLIFVNIITPVNTGCLVIDKDVAIYHGVYTIVMGGVLPPLVAIACTLLIWKRIKGKNQRRAMTIMNRAESHKNSRDHQVLVLLFPQVAMFILSTIPFMSNNLYTSLTAEILNKPIDRRAIEGFAQAMTELFVYIFPASSFYSNALVSRRFRKEWIATMKHFAKCILRGKRRIIPIIQAQGKFAINEIPPAMIRISPLNNFNHSDLVNEQYK
ncbi:unnamed protein product [Rotaria socialis]|uniref:G-protein coupled receptors family 1 profile domain-containing protein n=1 Tax=Rotaria socialis TaxID=392032 RepID=A0A821BDR5_9BILA|nr:unnamed protein product [Rotaria socialis]CAF4591919.1 unnamed protein product [Rotaria socialis]